MTFQTHPHIAVRFRAAYQSLFSKIIMDSQPWWELPVGEFRIQQMIDGI